MFKLATKLDVIEFVNERSPHVRKVSVEEKYGEVIITIKLSLLYSIFYRRTFLRYIYPQIQERALIGLVYKVIVI